MATSPEELAARVVSRLRDNDAWLCTIPHGQYETYDAHARSRAEELLAEALRVELEDFL